MLSALVETTHTDSRPLDEVVIEALVEQLNINPHDPALSNALKLVRRMFDSPKPIRSVHQWSKRTGVSRRSIVRHMAWAGFPHPVQWKMLSQLLWAQRTLYRVRRANRAAYAAGYPDPFTYSNQMLKVLGTRPSDVMHLTPDQLMAHWIERYRDQFGAPRAQHGRCPTCGRMMC